MISSTQLREFIAETDPGVQFIKELDPALVGLKNAIESNSLVPVYDMDITIELIMEKNFIEEETDAVQLLIKQVARMPKERRPCFVTYFRNPSELEGFVVADGGGLYTEATSIFDVPQEMHIDDAMERTLHIQRAIIQEHVIRNEECDT